MAHSELAHDEGDESQQFTPEQQEQARILELVMRARASGLSGPVGVLAVSFEMNGNRNNPLWIRDTPLAVYNKVQETLYLEGKLGLVEEYMRGDGIQDANRQDGFFWGGDFRTYDKVAGEFHLPQKLVRELVQKILADSRG